MAVAVAIKGFPSRCVQHFGIGDNRRYALKHFGASLRSHGVHVQADDEQGIVGHDGGQIIVNDVFFELQLVKLLVVEGKLRILEVEHRGVVARIEHRAIALHHDVADETSIVAILVDRDVERADNTLLLGILLVCPFAVVQKFGQGCLQGFEHFLVRTLNLLAIDDHFCLQFLCLKGKGHQSRQGNDSKCQQVSDECLHSL